MFHQIPVRCCCRASTGAGPAAKPAFCRYPATWRTHSRPAPTKTKKIAFCKGTSQVRIPVIVPVGLDIHFFPDGDHFFGLFFVLAEEFSRVPDTVAIGVEKD